MAKTYWTGGASAVKQVQTITIGTFDATTTYKVTIGGQTISVVGTTDANTTATNLKNALAASTHPYFLNITWTVATNVVTGTAGTAGVPFVLSTSVSGGIGTISNSVTTVSSGPNDWSTATNWSGGAVPVASDDVIIDRGPNIVWGLDQNGISLNTLTILQTFTGALGLNSAVFATNADASTTVTTAPEYRQTYLKIQCPTVNIGQTLGIASAGGSGRLKINNTLAIASNTKIYNTAAQGTETSQPAVRLLVNNSSANLYVLSAPGGVGVAVDAPGETSTLASISISDTSTASKIIAGDGVTLTNWSQNGGTNQLRAAAIVTTVTAKGGNLTLDGDYTITTLNAAGAAIIDNHIKTAGNSVTTCTLSGGSMDLTKNNQPRTYNAMNHNLGTLQYDSTVMTFTAFNTPSGFRTVQVS